MVQLNMTDEPWHDFPVTGMSNMNPQSRIVLWEGASQDLKAVASGGRVVGSSYVLTEDALKFARGVLSTREESIPLWVIRDCDLSQSLTQKARGVGDVTLRIDPAHAHLYGQNTVAMTSIRDPARVRDMIVGQANVVRSYWARHAHERAVEQSRAGATVITNQPATEQTGPATPAGAPPAQWNGTVWQAWNASANRWMIWDGQVWR